MQTRHRDGRRARFPLAGLSETIRVVRQGTRKVDLRATVGGVAPEDIVAEAASIEDDLKDYNSFLYPPAR